MRILDLAFKDILQILRDWKSFLFLLFMPILFTLVFGFAFGGANPSQAEVDERLPVGIVDRDGGPLALAFSTLMEKSAVIRPVALPTNQLEAAEKQVSENELAAVVVIPGGYSQAMNTPAPLPLEVIAQTHTNTGATAQNSIQAVVNRLVSASAAAEFSVWLQADSTRFDQAFDSALAAWDDPAFTLVSTQSGREAEDEPANAFAHSSSGMMVQFAIAGLIGAATVLVLERKSGALQRLLTTSISRLEILLGHFTAMFMMIFVQLAVLITFAAVFLEVGYFQAPLATLIIAVTTSLFTASLGLLIGALAQTEEQSIMFSLVPMFILSGLGGAWVPLEFTSPAFQKIGHFTPVAWALDGFQNITMRGLGLESVLLPALVLIGFATLCFGLAAWRFKFE